MPLSFIESPFPTKMAYEAWLRLPPADQPAARTKAALQIATASCVPTSTTTISECPKPTSIELPSDVRMAIAGFLKFNDLVLTAARVDRAFREAARVAIHAVWPALSPLLEAPFSLSRRDMLELTELRCARTSAHLGTSGAQTLANACVVGALVELRVLDLGRNRIGDDGCASLAEALASGGMPCLKVLDLRDNLIGDQGCMALVEACADGAMAQLRVLSLASNHIGSPSCAALATTCASGALAQLHQLELGDNQIDDGGCAVLARACVTGALPRLEVLDLQTNRIGDGGVSDLAKALAGGALQNLKVLCLNSNVIANGLSVLEEACAGGSRRKLPEIHLDVN